MSSSDINKIYFYKYPQADGTFKYVTLSTPEAVGAIKVGKYEYLSNFKYNQGINEHLNFEDIIQSTLDIVWMITTQYAQKLIRLSVVFEEIWLSNLFSAFKYDIGKLGAITDKDFISFEQIFDQIAATNMEDFLDIIDIFNDQGRFDRTDFVKLLVARVAIKGAGLGATVNPDGSLVDPLGGNAFGTQTPPTKFDPNKVP